MPENSESTEQQPVVEQEQPESGEQVEETEQQDSAQEPSGEESDQSAPEAESTPGEQDEPFDAKRAEAKIRKANSEAANLRKRLKELEPKAVELQRIKDAEKTESERLADQLTRANEQVATTRKELVKARVQAMATAKVGDRAPFTDPEDAVGALELGSYIDESGDIDEAAIEADLQALLERKPHWAQQAPPAPQEGPRRPAPDRTQASGAKQTRTPNPADEFAGFLKTRLKTGR